MLLSHTWDWPVLFDLFAQVRERFNVKALLTEIPFGKHAGCAVSINPGYSAFDPEHAVLFSRWAGGITQPLHQRMHLQLDNL